MTVAINTGTSTVGQDRTVAPVARLAAVVAAIVLGTGVAIAPIPCLVCGLGLVVIAVVARWPMTGVCLLLSVLTLVPLTAGVRLGQGLPVLFPSRVVLVIALIGLIINRAANRSRLTFPRRLALPALLVLAAFLGSSLLSVAPATSLFKLASIVLEFLLTFVLCWNVLSSARSARALLTFTILLTAIVSILGFAELLFGFSPTRLISTGYDPTNGGLYYTSGIDLTRAGYIRIRSTFVVPLELGVFLAMMVPSVVALIVTNSSFVRRALYAASLVVILGALAATLSTGPILAAATGLALLLTTRGGRWPVFAIALVGVIGIVVLSLGPYATVMNSVLWGKLDIASIGGQTTAGRIAILIAASNAFAARPILGYGLSTWSIIDPKAIFNGVGNYSPGTTGGDENYYAVLLVETGLIGAAAMAFLLYRLVSELRVAVKRANPPVRLLAVAGWASCIGFLLSNVTINELLGSPQLMSLFALLCAIWLRSTSPRQPDFGAVSHATPADELTFARSRPTLAALR